MSVLDHPLISERYFFPRPDAPPDPVIVRSGDVELACVSVGSDQERTLLHFHGNGEVVADYVPDFVAAVRALGLNVFLAEYRGYGASTGTPQFAAMLDDVDAIFAHLGLPEEKLVVFGRSVGSIYAIEFARRHPGIAGLVLESGIADPMERVLLRVTPEELGVSEEEFRAEARMHLDHRAKLAAYTNPLLVMHARGDTLVLPSHAERNHEWAGSKDKKLVLFDLGDHNSILAFNAEAYFNELRSFLGRL